MKQSSFWNVCQRGVIRYYNFRILRNSGILSSKDQRDVESQVPSYREGDKGRKRKTEWEKRKRRKRERIERHGDFIKGINPAVSEACILDIPVM